MPDDGNDPSDGFRETSDVFDSEVRPAGEINET